MAELPLVDEQLRIGAMSYSQTRAISRVATAENEKLWVGYAKHMPASQLDTLCRSYQNVQAYDQAHGSEAEAMAGAEPTSADQTPAEPTSAEPYSASASTTAHTPAEPLLTAPPTTKAPSFADRGRQRADAFMGIIQDRVRGAQPQRTPIEIIITVPHAGLHGSAAPSDLAMMADGEVIAMATARRFCCDAGVVVAHVDAHGVPLSVGRKTRAISAAIKRALRLRDRTCRFPWCTHSRYVDGHHIEHWANGGETALSNLVLLCSAHHTLLHEGGCRVQVNSSNGWNFFDHRNRLIETLPARTMPNDTAGRRGLAALHDAHAALAITANTNASKYTGEPIDYARRIDYLV